MERGIYFDGWYRANHCYHPSLPVRSRSMIDEVERFRGTMLVWAALGGGSISLPYLEHEANGAVDPRLRFYGHLNDREYIAECARRGIKVFGIVFESQGWEFPVAVAPDGKSLDAINVMDGRESSQWYGLREFFSDRHWEVFGKRAADYFPQGLIGEDGRVLRDPWEECATRDIDGNACHARWVEVRGHAHQCHLMCRNNPGWRRYLKKVMEIQIDAGVAGIQLDEPESPMIAIEYGGCFCDSCMNGFRRHLSGLARQGRLPRELKAADLEGFHYGRYLKERGAAYPGNRRDVPLFHEYWDFQMRSLKETFGELAAHARSYARSKGREIQVSGNFFNLHLVCYASEPDVDVVITEMRQTLFRQPAWYRYAAGFAGEKPVVVVENPYGGIIPELSEMLSAGRGADLYRLLLLEAAVYGCGMAVPYGAWMGNQIKDSFQPPRAATEEVQRFLADNERLYSRRSGSKLLLLYNHSVNAWREAAVGSLSQKVARGADPNDLLSCDPAELVDPEGPRAPFWEIAKALGQARVVYDARILADGDLRADQLAMEDLAPYRLIVLPDSSILTARQGDVLERFAQRGGRLLIVGDAGQNLDGWLGRVRKLPGVRYCADLPERRRFLQAFDCLFQPLHEDLWQVRLDDPSVGVHTHRLQGGVAIHLLNYRYDAKADAVQPVDRLELRVRGSHSLSAARCHTLTGRRLRLDVQARGGETRMTVHEAPLYTVVEVSDE